MAWRNDVCQWRKSSENDEKCSRFQLPISLLISVKKKTGRDVSRGGVKSFILKNDIFLMVWFARKLMSKIRKNATISGGVP
jgi:hypothetical protein